MCFTVFDMFYNILMGVGLGGLVLAVIFYFRDTFTRIPVSV